MPQQKQQFSSNFTNLSLTWFNTKFFNFDSVIYIYHKLIVDLLVHTRELEIKTFHTHNHLKLITNVLNLVIFFSYFFFLTDLINHFLLKIFNRSPSSVPIRCESDLQSEIEIKFVYLDSARPIRVTGGERFAYLRFCSVVPAVDCTSAINLTIFASSFSAFSRCKVQSFTVFMESVRKCILIYGGNALQYYMYI